MPRTEIDDLLGLVWEDSKDRRKRKKREYYEKNSAYYIKKAKEWRVANPGKYKSNVRKYNLSARFGMTEEQWHDLFKKQGSNCAICDGGELKWATDHCHNTGKIRGILCQSCNKMLGNAKDSKEILTKAIKYLESI